jgi:hypothetical protein
MPADQPRKHHYLPQFYLKGFADKNGRFWQCDRRGAKLVGVNVSKAGAEKDYHRFDVKASARRVGCLQRSFGFARSGYSRPVPANGGTRRWNSQQSA